MALAQLIQSSRLLVIHSHIHLYGDAASEQLSKQVADDIASHWNQPQVFVPIGDEAYKLFFDIQSFYTPHIQPEEVAANADPKLYYFRVEEVSPFDISFVDGIGSNTGYFKLANLLQTGTTAAHEFGHMIGLDHPKQLDVRGQGVPGIMYPRGTLCDPWFQYNPDAEPGSVGGTLDPKHRKVLLDDIEQLRLHKLKFNAKGFAVLGDFTSIYHHKYLAEK
ncbi:MAG: peptidase M10 [Chitinophagaceae bacterium]|nr:peptidase M10 [Chitinophagaceae bacterium]